MLIGFELEDYLKTYPGELRVSGSLEIDQRIKERHGRARDIYRTLKNNFRSIGYYDDASWAYFKERQMEKETFQPTRARRYYGHELPKTCSARSFHWWWFHLKYTAKWLLGWAAELSCGYGERPLRTVVWAGVILVMFPLLFRWTGNVVSEVGAMTWLDYFNYSLGAFTTIGFNQFRATTPLAQTLTSIEALLGISVLALLMFALGNRVSRL